MRGKSNHETDPFHDNDQELRLQFCYSIGRFLDEEEQTLLQDVLVFDNRLYRFYTCGPFGLYCWDEYGIHPNFSLLGSSDKL